MFDTIKKINSRPEPFSVYTANELWTNDHTAKAMLAYHLNESIDVSSRNKVFIERSVAWIGTHFNIGKNTAIADFGCGPGLYTTKFAQKGASVTGIDFSENSLTYAREIAEQNHLQIQYVKANYLEFDTSEKYDLITMIMCDYCALSPKQRKVMLGKFSSLLKPGGSVLLDVYSTRGFVEKTESATYERNWMNGFWSPDEYYCFVNTFKYEHEKVSLDKYTIVEKAQTRVVYNWLQHFSKESLEKEFEECGFKVKAFYANVAGDAFDPEGIEFAIVASI